MSPSSDPSEKASFASIHRRKPARVSKPRLQRRAPPPPPPQQENEKKDDKKAQDKKEDKKDDKKDDKKNPKPQEQPQQPGNAAASSGAPAHATSVPAPAATPPGPSASQQASPSLPASIVPQASMSVSNSPPAGTSSKSIDPPNSLAASDGTNANAPGPNVGAIVGGVLAGVVVVAAALFLYRRKRRGHQKTANRELGDSDMAPIVGKLPSPGEPMAQFGPSTGAFANVAPSLTQSPARPRGYEAACLSPHLHRTGCDCNKKKSMSLDSYADSFRGVAGPEKPSDSYALPPGLRSDSPLPFASDKSFGSPGPVEMGNLDSRAAPAAAMPNTLDYHQYMPRNQDMHSRFAESHPFEAAPPTNPRPISTLSEDIYGGAELSYRTSMMSRDSLPPMPMPPEEAPRVPPIEYHQVPPQQPGSAPADVAIPRIELSHLSMDGPTFSVDSFIAPKVAAEAAAAAETHPNETETGSPTEKEVRPLTVNIVEEPSHRISEVPTVVSSPVTVENIPPAQLSHATLTSPLESGQRVPSFLFPEDVLYEISEDPEQDPNRLSFPYENDAILSQIRSEKRQSFVPTIPTSSDIGIASSDPSEERMSFVYDGIVDGISPREERMSFEYSGAVPYADENVPQQAGEGLAEERTRDATPVVHSEQSHEFSAEPLVIHVTEPVEQQDKKPNGVESEVHAVGHPVAEAEVKTAPPAEENSVHEAAFVRPSSPMGPAPTEVEEMQAAQLPEHVDRESGILDTAPPILSLELPPIPKIVLPDGAEDSDVDHDDDDEENTFFEALASPPESPPPQTTTGSGAALPPNTESAKHN
ncbi:uncharacterized protein VTP21DRAFT_1256 [Calcarisporiella thermophila]|uniref:uncharacterized protein n=1 Tax=Calcarisporiella thermophila TaxID=911321 RepID=UPI003742F3F9